MTKILITGGTGLVGKKLINLLLQKGYEVGVLSRKVVSIKNVHSFLWDKTSVDKNALEFADVIVHLAGASVGAKRWTKKRKQEIITSRVTSAELIRQSLLQNKITIDAFISASAVGIYGERSNEMLTEKTATKPTDFLSTVCSKWETKANEFSSICRSVSVRIGFVLDKEAEGFQKLVNPIKMGIGAPLGNGNQYMSWIHLDDLVNVFVQVIENKKFIGSVNACSPEPLTNRELTKQVAQHLQKPLFMPAIPKFVLKIILGEMSDLALIGNRVIPQKLITNDFQFTYPTLKDALKEIYP